MKSKVILVLVFLIAILFGKDVVKVDGKYSYKVTQNSDNTYKYQVFENGKDKNLKLDLPGFKGFPEQWQAEEAARLLIKKLKTNQTPQLLPHELDELFKKTNPQVKEATKNKKKKKEKK